MRYYLTITLLSLLPLFSTVSAQRQITAKRINADIKIDGELSEEFWKSSEIADKFVINYPAYGNESKFQTFVYIVYDDNALYVAAELFDPKPDSVNFTFSQRDDFGNGDWFGIVVDPYQNGVTAMGFAVTAAGVEVDALQYVEGDDISWNAIWKSATKRTEYGWSVEMRIPYSAVRFPNKPVQSWNINFYRQVRRNRELSTWNPMDPEVYGEITQMGVLNGIENVKSPLRLSFTPYSTGYLENSYNSISGEQEWAVRGTYGMDLKYGINDAFTLDMTLIPDFGQTVSDNKVLNLGPFEVQYNENRPFFLEGTDLFGIGGIFYSRRIGGTPYNYYNINLNDSIGEEIISNPALAPLLNASKFSGRTKSGLGIGVFNAIENKAFATIEDQYGNTRQVETNPFTNYNVFVLSQNLANNSKVSFLNTNVTRAGDNRNANVSSISSNIFSSDKKFRISTLLNTSVLIDSDVLFGHSFNATMEKVSGRVRHSLWYSEVSNTYNPNDLGFLYNNNSRTYGGMVEVNDFTPGKYFLRKWGNISINYNELYKPSLFSTFSLDAFMAGTFNNYLTCGVSLGGNPVGSVDHFESRTFGKSIRLKPSAYASAFYSSDYSKRFALDIRVRWWAIPGTGQYAVGGTLSPRWRVSDRMFMVWTSNYDYFPKDFGYVSILDEAYQNEIIIGVRDQYLVENSLRSEFIFTKRMGVDLRLRHYWTQVDYVNFRELQDDGNMLDSEYNPLGYDGTSLHNTSYNAFTLDVNYRWVFIPGSELRIVYKNNLFYSKNVLDANYFQTFEDLFNQPQINSISVKFLIFVDVLYFRKKHKNLAQ